MALLLAASAPGEAQRTSAPPGSHPGWLPPGPVRIGGGLTAAQRAEAVARLEEIKRILLQVPELAQPNGFEVMADMYGGARMLGPGGTERPGNVVEYMLRVWFFYPTKRQAGEGCTCLWVRVNPVGFMGADAKRDEEGREIYVQGHRGEPVAGATQVFGELSPTQRSIVDVLFTSGGVLPWKPVTREQYYGALIFDVEGKNGEKMAAFRKGLTTTRYQQWMEGAAQRKKNRDEALKAAAAVQTAEEVAKMRRTLEDTEREVTENLKKSEAQDRERNQEASGRLVSDKWRAALEAMTPAERNMPALIDATQGWNLVDRDTSRVLWPVLTPDYDFWRARRSPVEARSIQVHIGASLTGERPPVHNALWQTFRKVDWAAIAGLLDVPR